MSFRAWLPGGWRKTRPWVEAWPRRLTLAIKRASDQSSAKSLPTGCAFRGNRVVPSEQREPRDLSFLWASRKKSSFPTRRARQNQLVRTNHSRRACLVSTPSEIRPRLRALHVSVPSVLNLRFPAIILSRGAPGYHPPANPIECALTQKQGGGFRCPCFPWQDE
jgi:hypothetical protein